MKKKDVFVLLMVGVFILVTIGIGLAFKNEYSTKLLPMVGQKIGITLKNGETVSGTLWDFGEDYITVKVKKGLVYSKAVKYGMSELQSIEDLQGNTINISEKEETDKNPTAIFFNMDDTEKVPEKESGSVKPTSEQNNGLQIVTRSHSETQKAVEYTQNSNDTVEVTKQDIPSPQVKPVYITRKPHETTKPKTVAESKTVLNSESGTVVSLKKEDKPKPTIIAQKKKSQAFISGKPKSEEKLAAVESLTSRPIARETKPEPTEIKEKAIIPVVTESTSQAKPEIAAKEVMVMRYRMLILFGVVGFIAVVLLAAKLLGVKGAAYGKHSLFPSKIIKMDGKYCVIDQGADDGVKLDDIIRFYRKEGKDIEYRGLVKVKKVGDNYSAVEILKVKKGCTLEIGDVGFRDHNFVATTMKKLRILTGILLNLVGKGILYTAKNIEVKEEIPDIKLDKIQKVENNKTPEDEKKVTASGESPKNAPKKKTIAANSSSKNGKSVGFGVEKG